MDYAIGDIHGCLDKVLRLLEVLRYDPAADRLIFLGDYIDRGPDSKGVLDLMLHLQQDNPSNAGQSHLNHKAKLIRRLEIWSRIDQEQ